MSDGFELPDSGERLLTFEVGSGVYALPITGVIEVVEVESIACIPMLPLSVAGVSNHHGDALPVIRRSSLFDVDEAELPEPAHVLVVNDRVSTGTHLGVPVDRVVGLVDGIGVESQGSHPIAERRPIDGRLVSILDPQRLLARAREVIEGALVRTG